MISVQTEDFDIGTEYAALRNAAGDAGAIVLFTGLVRELYESGASEKIQSLTLEHYPGMTEKNLAEILAQANARWSLLAARIIHRVGELQSGEQIVLVGTASSHRHHAFEAAQFMMDYLKSNAPFWKKQQTSAASHWVESRDTDAAALERWQTSEN
jgi:molybdopterin synthase catalytic subunit